MAIADVSSSDGIARNEVYEFEMGRYISSNEAVWRILSFPINERHPIVINLSVHLENGQGVYFTEGNAAERAQFAPGTTLTAFLQLCKEDEFARTLFYHQVPRYNTWDSKKRSRIDEKLVNLYLTILESSQLMPLVRSLGGSDLKTVGLPQSNRDSNTIDERTYNVSELRRFLEENEGKMLPDQGEIF
ncbi:helitron_like_N domain-containing protein [Trichonephila clavata]|uniref:Helitron_like_N domain-containing protein n=1 Tax=Trichonephila clavata TaxID=2740835 RepID=A0A8X6LT67_TRICU|nr:helitron_like_N domain-containing protein [Trichonephila clavata]